MWSSESCYKVCLGFDRNSAAQLVRREYYLYQILINLHDYPLSPHWIPMKSHEILGWSLDDSILSRDSETGDWKGVEFGDMAVTWVMGSKSNPDWIHTMKCATFFGRQRIIRNSFFGGVHWSEQGSRRAAFPLFPSWDSKLASSCAQYCDGSQFKIPKIVWLQIKKTTSACVCVCPRSSDVNPSHIPLPHLPLSLYYNIL